MSFKNINKIKLVRVPREIQYNIFNKLRKLLELEQLQTYNPILAEYMTFFNNPDSPKLFIMESKYTIKDIKKIIQNSNIMGTLVKPGNILVKMSSRNDENNDNDENNANENDENNTPKIELVGPCFHAIASVSKNTNNNNNNNNNIVKHYDSKHTQDMRIFIKIIPLLHPIQYMMKDYIDKESSNQYLPNIYSYLTTKKINNKNNTGYIEFFFNYLASRLVEKGKCPTFPYFYGTFSGISKQYQHDINDEYHSIKRKPWFQKGLGKLYDILEVTLEDEINAELESVSDKFENASNSSNSVVSDLESISDLESVSNFDDLDNLDNLDNLNLNNIDDVDNSLLDSDVFRNNLKSEVRQELNNLQNNLILPKSNGKNNQVDLDKDFINELSDNELSDNELSDNELNDVNSNKIEMNKIEANDVEANDVEANDVEANDVEVNDIEVNNIELNDIEVSDNELESNNDFIENIEDLDLDIDFNSENIKRFPYNSDTSSSSNNSSRMSNTSFMESIEFDDDCVSSTFIARLYNFPVQVICSEYLSYTLDEILDKGYKMSDIEWASILFQICFGMAVGQKYFSFSHNDLHSSNIMFKQTKNKYLYFSVEGNYYKIPTFNKITKIIDFARATFKVGKNKYFSDVFAKKGDAEGQYSYPYYAKGSKCRYKPNPSFDLSRLATTIQERIPNDSNVRYLIDKWMTNKYGENMGEEEDSFDLYVKISRTINSAVPISQFKEKLFNQFKISKNHLPRKPYVYYY